MGIGHGAEAIMAEANTAGGAQLSFFSLIWTVLFSVVVFAAVQHGGPEDSEERVVPVPLRVTALVTAAVSGCPAECKRRFLTYTDRNAGFPKSGHGRRGACEDYGGALPAENSPWNPWCKRAAVGRVGSPGNFGLYLSLDHQLPRIGFSVNWQSLLCIF